MSKEHKKDHHEDNFEQIEEVLTSSEQFIEKHQKQLVFVVFVILALIGGIIGYNKLYKAPQEKEAIEQAAGAQLYFSKDSYKLALNGDGNKIGFIDIAKEYSGTKIGNTAHVYAGICYLKLGNFDEAINYLKGFESDDFLVSQLALANLGDAYIEKGDFKKAAKNYSDAAKDKTNNFTSPIFLMKAGCAYELAKDFKKALETYKTIEKDFSKSMEAREIEKYITRAELNIK